MLLPNHRSYLDYVLIPYLFYANGVKLPFVTNDTSIANIFLLSGLMKNIGAFELDRRSYKRDRLYRAVFD